MSDRLKKKSYTCIFLSIFSLCKSTRTSVLKHNNLMDDTLPYTGS